MIRFCVFSRKENTLAEYLRSNWIWIFKALWASALFLCISLLLGMYWETNDDPSIAYLLSLKNNDYSPFQWQLLSSVLHFLIVNFPVVNWWTVNTVFAIWLSAFSISYVIYRRYPTVYADALVGIALVALWVTAGYSMNFTRTAAAVAIGGCLLIADSTLTDAEAPYEYIVGCLLLLYGASIRSLAALIALGFLAVIGGVWLLGDRFAFRKTWFCEHLRPIVGLCLAAIIFFGGSVINSLFLSPEEKAYNAFNEVRSEVQDYADSFPSYESAKDLYDELGIDASLRESLLHKWFSEDTDVITTQMLTELSALKTKAPSLEEWYTRADNSVMLLKIALVMCVLVMLRNKWNILKMLPPVGFAVVCSLFLAWNGRLPIRVFASIFFAMICAVIFLSGDPHGIAKREIRNTGRPWLQKIKPICRVLMVVCCFFGFAVSVWVSRECVDNAHHNGHKLWWPNTQVVAQRAKSLDVINSSKEYTYIFDLLANPYSVTNAYGLWEDVEVGYCDNMFLLGGWDARHPDNMERLAERGITNPVKAVFENPRVRSTYSADLLRYIRNTYNERITVSEIGMFGDSFFVQYCAPVDDSQIVPSGEHIAQITEIRQCADDQSDCWYFAVDVSENGQSIRDFYCNITLGQTRYTYRLAYAEGSASAYLYEIGEKFDLSQADVCIFELSEDGRYIGYEIQ